MSSADEIKKYAIEALKIESQAIEQLTQYINDDFVSVVQLILNSTGRVVITGIGKSAIVAQKIVATLNSTGTPSIFMHAADAIHGDLGNIQNLFGLFGQRYVSYRQSSARTSYGIFNCFF